ncbi:MAG: FHA domain-containing protein [Gemmatimonadales bacterium]|nr:FHA domain-containing protein [Gemmatimonadales bacterium]
MRHFQTPQPSPPGAPLALVAEGGEQVFQVPAGARLLVGRAPESHIQLTHPSVSRTHAEVYRDAGGVHVRDLGSGNGTENMGLGRVELPTSRLSGGPSTKQIPAPLL